MHPNIHCSIIYNSQDMKVTQVSTDKEDMDCIYNGILHCYKTEQNLAICDSMAGSKGYCAE